MASNECRRKPRTNVKPYDRPPRKPNADPGPKTSAKKPQTNHARENLTLNDWLTVVTYHDTHKPISQQEVVAYFAKRPEGALIFTQSSLSRHLSKKGREEDQAKSLSTPVALSTKRAWIVTRPDVEKALVLWVKHMEEKGETVSGPMLVAKREKYEKELDVPDEERMKSDGWVPKFCKMYGLQERRRHGEAGSVDLAAVAEERKRLSKILAEYPKKNRLNFDESGLFGFAPPDWGLASQQMSGKKSSKFRITVGFLCNADGSEKWPIFFIGKSKKPRCFGKITPQQRGFYYRNNKTAWMTSAYFEEWIKMLDRDFKRQKRKVILLLDNFPGHDISYKPENICLEPLAPNMTSFVQPLDSGIIRCFKAHYRRAFCYRAIELDEAGEDNIYKINLLEIMLMANAAWDAVSAETIRNCWNHSGIQGNETADVTNMQSFSSVTDSPCKNPSAWEIMAAFACGDVSSMPEMEGKLKGCLGDHYVDSDWKPVFDAIFATEEDTPAAVAVIEKLRTEVMQQPIARTATQTPTRIPQLENLETELVNAITELKARKRIVGTPPSLEDLLNPIEEKEVGDSPYRFPGGDSEILAEAVRETHNKGLEEADNESDGESEAEDDVLSFREGIDLCKKLEKACVIHSDAEGVAVLELQKQLRKMRIHFHHLEAASQKQLTLDTFWSVPEAQML